MSKKSKPRPAKVPAGPPPDLELPHSFVKSGMGITEAVYQFLEVRHPSRSLLVQHNANLP